MTGVEVISYLIMGLSVLASCKIVGLELFGLLQLAYFNLADNTFWNVHLAPLSSFSHFNGYNTDLFEENSELPSQIEEMSVDS